jgi:MFS family permease
MYTTLRETLPAAPIVAARPGRRVRLAGVSGNVVLLGVTSFFTDISSEMVSTVLPLYLVLHLQMSAFQFGVLDGLYQGTAALVRVAGGLAADRWRRHKEVAAVGYGLSAACKLGLLAAGTAWTGLAGVIMLDRAGKGVRTAPRDALISLSSPRDNLATAFGVHRALDTAGALLGPLVAFGLLAVAPAGYDAVFVASFCAALVGLGVLVLFVENRPAADVATHVRTATHGSTVSLGSALRLLSGTGFRVLVLAGAALGLVTVSDGFMYLMLQRKLDLAPSLFPLLYVVSSLIYFLLAIPVGQLADRVGRGRVFLGGHLLLAVAYAVLLLPSIGYPGLLGCLLLVGAYYAATDGVLMALASTVLPENLRGSGLALVATATGLARLLSSVLFGALWTWASVEVAIMTFLVGMLAAAGLVAAMLARTSAEVGHAGDVARS